jgi:general secretion pathway protein N
MKFRTRYLAIGLVTLLLGLVIFFPARVAYRWFVPDTISFAGISGSVWNGGAREAYAQGIYVRDLSWRMQPLALLTGGVGFSFAANPQPGFMEGTVKLGFSGQIAFEELTMSLALQNLQPLIGLPGLSGTANARFPRLVLNDGLPTAAEGVIDVSNLVVPNLYRGSVGGYRAEFFTQDSGVMASVEDTDGLIDIAGSLHLTTDRSYEFIAQIAPKNDTPASVRQQMQYLGSANERGQHELRLEGRL